MPIIIYITLFKLEIEEDIIIVMQSIKSMISLDRTH